MASTSLPSEAPLSPSLRRPAKLSGAYAYASTQARSGWRKVSANALRRRSMSAVRFADDQEVQQCDDMPPPAKIPRRSQPSRPSLGGLVQPPPTLAVRCQALAANALAVLSFYAQLADEDFDERNWLSHNMLAHMRRSWEPFDSYKTNQLLESAQYHHHFIDADEVARSLVDARRLRDHGPPLGFRETMLIANCATFLHYVWSLPTSPLPASSSVGIWPCRNVAELQDAWRVFLRHIVPQDRPLDDDILALHLELSTQVYIARLAQLQTRDNQDQAQIEAEADAELEELLGPDSLARDTKRKIQNQWLALANARSQELESVLYDVEACRSTFPISQLALNMTALVLDIVSQVEAQIRDYQEPHLLGSLFAPAMPAAQPPPRRVSLPRNEPPVLPAGFYQPQDIQREAWLRELLVTESQSADSSANMSGVTGWGAASQADSASDYLDARDRMEIFKGLLADERAFPGATVRQSSRSQSRSFGASPLIPRGSMRAASAFSVSTSVAMREYDQHSRQASTSGHRSRRSLSGFHVPEAITEGSGEESEPSVSTQIRQEAMRELEARPPPPSSPPRGPFAASIQQQRRRSSAQQAGPSRSPPRPPPRSPAAGIQVRQGHLVRGPAPLASFFHDREVVGERMTRFDSQDGEGDGQESEDIFLERQRAKQRLNQRDQGRATYKKGRRAAAAHTPAGPVRWPKPPRKPMPFSVAVPPLAEATASSSSSSPSTSRRRSTRPPSEGLPAARASEGAPHVQTTTTAAGATVITATTISDADRARLEEWREQTLRNADKDAEGGFEGGADETLVAVREQLTLEYWFSRIRPGLENLPEPRPQLNLQAAVAAAVEEKRKGTNLARLAVLQPHLLPSDGERDEHEEGAGDEDGAQDVAEPIDEERDEEREEEEQVATQLSAPPSRARSASALASSDDTDSDDEINVPDGDDDDDDDDFRPSGSRRRRGRPKKQQKSSQQKKSSNKTKASSRPPRSQTSTRHTASQASQPPSSSQKRNNAAWTDEERETFLASMYQLARYKEVDPHYQVYAQILSRHGRTGSESRILARRSNADLKAQARVELWRLKDEGELIPYWKRLLMPRVFLDARPRATRQAAEPIVISDVSEGEEEREEAGEMEEQAQGEAAEQGEVGLQEGQGEQQPGHGEEQQGEAMTEAEVAAAVAAAAAAGAGAAPSMEVEDENAAVEPYDLDGGADFGVQEPVNFEEYLVEDAERNEGEQGEAAQEERAEDVEADEEAAEEEVVDDGEASGEEEQAPGDEAPDGRPASDVGLLLAFDSSGQTSPLSSVPPEEPSARFVDEPLSSEGSPRRSQRSRRAHRAGDEETQAPKQASKGSLRKRELAPVDPSSSSSSSPRRIGPSTSSTTPLPATRSATATTTLRRGRSRKG